MSDSRPTLIQLDISHYSEKVRWALDYKQVPHVRRSPLPPARTSRSRDRAGYAWVKETFRRHRQPARTHADV